mgnify:CR=1 FL=1
MGTNKITMEVTVKESLKSIVINGLTFFASTVGMVVISDIELIKNFSAMIAKRELISTRITSSIAFAGGKENKEEIDVFSYLVLI